MVTLTPDENALLAEFDADLLRLRDEAARVSRARRMLLHRGRMRKPSGEGQRDQPANDMRAASQ